MREDLRRSAARIAHLHFATVIKISQALSGAIVQDNLIGTLLRAALEETGAQRELRLYPVG